MNNMELRDYFAGKVLGAIHSSPEMFESFVSDRHKYARNESDSIQDYVAQECYRMADAMLKEREIKEPQEPEVNSEPFGFEILVDGVDEWKGGSKAVDAKKYRCVKCGKLNTRQTAADVEFCDKCGTGHGLWE